MKLKKMKKSFKKNQLVGLAHGWYPPKSNLGLKRIFSFTLLVVIKTNIHIPCSEVLSRNLELEEAKKKESNQEFGNWELKWASQKKKLNLLWLQNSTLLIL